MELLIGCGSSRERKIQVSGRSDWTALTTLDMTDIHNPDVVHDLMDIPLPFQDNTFDEIHAYDVMEHLGQQGDWRWFLAQWSDFHRILNPNGVFCGISPHISSPWLWGDPGHTRAITLESFTFLDQSQYTKQVGKTPITDYRFCYQADFEVVAQQVDEAKQFAYILRAIKPSRITL